MKTIPRLLCILIVLMATLGVQAETITFDFDDGTAQGWINDEKAGREFVAWDTADDDNGGQFIAYSGDFAMRIDEYSVRDDTTDLLMITSPEFKIANGTTIEIYALGGTGPIAQPTWSNYEDVPTVATGSGFMGTALRRVSDGEYILFGRRDISSESDNDPSWTAIEWTAADIAAAVASDSPSERYVIDVIDSYTGGWGWFGFDEVTLTNVSLIDDSTASDPIPYDGAQDVVPAPTLQWSAGMYAETHDVYFGTDFDDVNNATVNSDVYMGRQSHTEFVPGELELGQTYYWRIDEVNAAPDFTIYKGDTWSFTVEPFAYAVENVLATSNTISSNNQGPEKLVDGSGLNENGEHATTTTTMWVGSPVEGQPPYVQFEFDRVYKLYEMLVWNYNMEFEFLLGFGVKDATVEYSVDGVDWTVLSDVQLAQGTSQPTYTANNIIAFDGVAAKFVRLTIASSWVSTSSHGLSEVRFMYIPVHAREPQPEDGATGISIDSNLTWRPGRDAISHDVYLGTDPNALVLTATPAQTSVHPDLDIDMTYYWQVDETDADRTWEGKLWSFTTQEYLVIDDMEAYTDDIDAGQAIWQTWIDALEDPSNGGSQVGPNTSPFAELDIVHTGKQSMSLFFDNAGASAISEADLNFAPAQDWTAGGVKSLTFWFHGAQGNTGRLYVKINGAKIDYDGPAVNIARPSWQPWSIDLSTVGGVGNVTTLSIGIEGAGSGVIYIDDVRLYPEVLDYLSPDITGPGDTVQGVPNDGDWPTAEYPDLAIDDDVTTKFLHRKGGSMATGIQIAPLAGSTVVTGLTFTTANDAPARDPITFELSGSNAGIDGPYTLIASGDIVDFADAIEWPRFTKTETSIEFGNSTAYTYYQIVFPSLRGSSESLMQIAEVELLGTIQ